MFYIFIWIFYSFQCNSAASALFTLHSPYSCGSRATAETEAEAEMRREIQIRWRGRSFRPGEAARGESVVQFVRLSSSCSGHRSQRQDMQNGSAVKCFKMGKKMKTETRTNNVESRQSTCNRILCKIVFALWLRLALKPFECTHTHTYFSFGSALPRRSRSPAESLNCHHRLGYRFARSANVFSTHWPQKK